MNDFTKEELEEIVDMMHHARKQGIEATHNLSYKVELKAKYMIDNYCAHEHTTVDSFTLEQCARCGEIVNDN